MTTDALLKGFDQLVAKLRGIPSFTFGQISFHGRHFRAAPPGTLEDANRLLRNLYSKERVVPFKADVPVFVVREVPVFPV
jgi:hypothetical protein